MGTTEVPATRALVTGATAGLGREIALQLARDGMELIVVGRNAERGAAVVAQIGHDGGQARFIAADLLIPEEIERLAGEAGEIDVLVNNAASAFFALTEDTSVERLDILFAANIRAPFLLVAAFAPAMAARGTGTIINISSIAGRIGLPSSAAYGATKAALNSLTQSWAAEYSQRGVRVNAVSPGPVHTRPADAEHFDAMGSTTALGRAAQPAEIAEVVAFLASPRASYMSGSIVDVDGGRTAI